VVLVRSQRICNLYRTPHASLGLTPRVTPFCGRNGGQVADAMIEASHLLSYGKRVMRQPPCEHAGRARDAVTCVSKCVPPEGIVIDGRRSPLMALRI
jgi:hypothetical protein